MNRPVFFAFALCAAMQAGCGGTSNSNSSSSSSNYTPTLPDYTACMSTSPLDVGNPNEPVITLKGPRVVSQPLGTPYTDAGATAQDSSDGDITSKIVVTGLSSINTNSIGDYLVRYNLTDSAHFTAREVVRVVRVYNNGAFAVHTPHDIGTTGAHMAYWEHLPTHYSDDPNQKFPLIIFIHGWSHARFLDPTDEQVPLSTLENVSFDGIFNGAYATWDNSRPFIVLSPQKCVDALTYGATAYRMKLFIDYAVNTYQVDPTRIYMGGHSEGSGDTWDYVTNYPKQLAAVFPISGGYGTTSGCLLKDTPSWGFIGQDDTVVNQQGYLATINSINACNPHERAKFTILPGADHNAAPTEVLTLSGLGQGLPAYDIYNPSIYDWLLAHSRP